jgi:hypothetical protein
MIIITYRRHVRFALVLTFLATLVQAATSPSTASWRVGTGREIITPPAGVWMTGYAARSHPAEGTAQDLWVKALAFADPTGQRGVLITLDLCGITQEITARVCAQLEKKHQLPRAAVMINVSHTHCSPWFEGSIIGLRILPADGLAKAEAYRRDLEQKIVRAADYALSHLVPATIAWGEDSASFGVNRRENPEKEMPARRAAGTLSGPAQIVRAPGTQSCPNPLGICPWALSLDPNQPAPCGPASPNSPPESRYFTHSECYYRTLWVSGRWRGGGRRWECGPWGCGLRGEINVAHHLMHHDDANSKAL